MSVLFVLFCVRLVERTWRTRAWCVCAQVLALDVVRQNEDKNTSCCLSSPLLPPACAVLVSRKGGVMPVRIFFACPRDENGQSERNGVGLPCLSAAEISFMSRVVSIFFFHHTTFHTCPGLRWHFSHSKSHCDRERFGLLFLFAFFWGMGDTGEANPLSWKAEEKKKHF